MALRMNPLENITSPFTFTVAAVAHLFARRFEDCLYWARRATTITPQARIPQWCAAAALGHLGRLEEARAEIDKILALHPGATLARARIASFRYDRMYELYLDGLRKAGLPEEQPAPISSAIACRAGHAVSAREPHGRFGSSFPVPDALPPRQTYPRKLTYLLQRGSQEPYCQG